VEAKKLGLNDNHFYFALLAELYTGVDNDKAVESLQTALYLAKTPSDRQAIQTRLDRFFE
jgi:predicted RNA polymerase sigma factor